MQEEILKVLPVEDKTLIEQLNLHELWVSVAMPWGIKLLFAIIIFVVGRWLIKWVIRVLKKITQKANMDPMLSKFVLSIVNALLLLFVVIAVLSQLGVDTTSLIALVGAAGLAIGLALQNSLQNFAAGVLLIIFKPFKVGDMVEAGGISGVVEAVGVFTSMLRTGDNKEIIVPNGSIYSGHIVNYSKRDTRRVDMVFGIGYDADVKLAKSILERLVAEDERVLKDPLPVIAVSELADSSINFIVRPWVNTADYWPVYWSMNEKVLIAFGEANVTIPYPQMDVHVHSITKN